jgi:hypothetical protein
MRRVAVMSAALLTATVCPPVAAQSLPPSPAPSCILTAHPGVTARDAQTGSAIACEQLASVSLVGGHWFAISMVQHGDSLLVCADERNAHGRSAGVHCAWAAGSKAAPGWAARIAHDFQGSVRELPAVSSPKNELERKSWYGWQTLTVAGVSALPYALVMDGKSVPVGYFIAGTAGLLLGPPVVHLAHRNWGRAAGSFIMGTMPAVALTLVGIAGADACNRSDDGESCGPPAVAILAILALIGHTIAYIATDSSTLAWNYGPVHRAPENAFVMPRLSMTRNGSSLGLGGSF